MHCPGMPYSNLAGAVPAIRLSTVLAACGASCDADAQHMRSGCPDGAAQSPAAMTRRSSTLVSVSSVSSRPSSSVCSPLAAARSGTPKPAVQIVTALGRTAPSAKTTASGRTSVTTSVSSTATPQPGQHLGDRPTARLGQRRPQLTAADQRDFAALLGELGGRLDPGQPGADDGHRCVRVQVVEAARRRCACSSSAMG